MNRVLIWSHDSVSFLNSSDVSDDDNCSTKLTFEDQTKQKYQDKFY